VSAVSFNTRISPEINSARCSAFLFASERMALSTSTLGTRSPTSLIKPGSISGRISPITITRSKGIDVFCKIAVA
jgi:hypothetical protein